MKRKLRPKQQAFVDCYDGNGVKAARKAGYSGLDATLRATASKLLTKHNIQEALKLRNAPEEKERIADREERQEFWTNVMKDKAEDMRDRLAAARDLGKSEGDFLERISHEGELIINVITWDVAKAKKNDKA